MNKRQTTSFPPPGSALKAAGAKTGALVDNVISVPAWYLMLNVIRLTPGTPLQRLVKRHWDASR
ncbi:hypothetical protein ACFTXB_03880 [Streptomyces sp. NPDC057074]|uniref:hypothetical protein n=1 Tax=Streptomyces sp. NPDC057074 TaxID=3346015 RepID=UPI00362D2BB5